MGFDVKGKVALVTGANRGIGKAITVSLLAHGARKVYAAVRTLESAKPLVEKYGERVEPVHLDLAEPESIKKVADMVRDVQLVINNAGVFKESGPLDDGAIESLQFQIEINVNGLIRMAQAFASLLEKNGGGAFVQLNSVASLTSFPGFATYCASKAAAYSITLALRSNLEEQGTHVLSVHPGPIATDMGEDAGMTDIAEPPSKVGEGIVSALASGDFYLWPDTMAQQMGAAYDSFAKSVVLAPSMEG